MMLSQVHIVTTVEYSQYRNASCDIMWSLCLISPASFGPIFGAGADLSVSSDCNANSDSYSNFPHSYGEPNQYPVSLAGDYHFKVDDYEVFMPRSSQQLNGR